MTAAEVLYSFAAVMFLLTLFLNHRARVAWRSAHEMERRAAEATQLAWAKHADARNALATASKLNDAASSQNLVRLVRWLALAFRVTSYDENGDEHVTWNTPVFPKGYTDAAGWHDMPEAQEMERLFHAVVGPKTP